MELNVRQLGIIGLLQITLNTLLIHGYSYAQPNKPTQKELVSKIQELQATQTTPQNLQERAKEIKKLLQLLEQKRGKEVVEQIVSPETKQAFAKAMRSKDYGTACPIADEIIANLAEFARSTRGKAKTKEKGVSTADEHIVKFKGKDGKDVYGYLLKPKGEEKNPAIILLHGGVSSKEATCRIGVTGKHVQLFNKEGYVTLAVHYRKSEFGGKEIDDVTAGLDYLKTLDFVDSDRIGLFGSSHGAYMSLLTSARVGNQVKAVVDNFGFTDLITQYDNVAVKRVTCHPDEVIKRHIKTADKYFGGRPGERNQHIYEERSPLHNVDTMTAPILIIHGKNDCSVPIENQVYAFRDELQKAGKIYEIKIYEDSPHGFIYKNTPEAKDALKVTLTFLDKHLKIKVREKEQETAVPYKYFDSPFGFHSGYYDVSPYKHAQEIGVRWDRGTGLGTYITPMPQVTKGKRVNKDEVMKEARTRIARKVYAFDHFDKYIKQVPEGIHIVQNIGPMKKEAVPWVKLFNKPNSWLPKEEHRDYYLTFVQKVVERYDGDGADDMPGLAAPIKYWQIGNEPHYKPHLRDLAKLIKITQPVIKKADAEAKIILAGASLQPMLSKYLKQLKTYYYPILDELDSQYIDVFDLHWYGKADGDYKKIRVIYDDIRKYLDQKGFTDTEIWVTEMGTYSGAIESRKFNWSFQSEKQQAGDLLKRYVYSLSLGIKKIFWAWGVIEGFGSPNDDNYFDHTGLIYDGKKLSDKDIDRGKGIKKLAFYTYKLMTEKLEGSDWDQIGRIQERGGIYVYKFRREGKHIWVAWNDNMREKKVVIHGIKSDRVKITEAVPRHNSGKDVRDIDKAFKVQTQAKQDEKVSFNLGQIPVFIEEE